MEVLDQPGFEFLRQFSPTSIRNRPGLAPLAGGAVGYPGVRCGALVRAGTEQEQSQVNSADAAWMFFRNIIAFDRLRQQMEITSIVFVIESGGNDEKLRELYEQAIAETAEIERQLNRELVSNDTTPGCETTARDIESN